MLFFKKQRRPAPFNIKPVYWDPEKEAREERERRIKSELGLKEYSKEKYIPNIKGKFRSSENRGSLNHTEAKKKTYTKLFVFIAILTLVMFLILYGLPIIESLLKKYADS